MILRRILRLFSSLYVLSLVSAEDAFDCRFSIDELSYDLTKLAGEHSVQHTRDLPPTTMVDTASFNLCEELKPKDGVDSSEQCPSGSRACLTTTNQKKDQKDRIVAVVPVAQTQGLNPEYSKLPSQKGISLTLHGGSYPHPTTSSPTNQSVIFDILCATKDEASDPTYTSYDGSQLKIEWKAEAGCGFKAGDKEDDNEDKNDGSNDEEPVGSGIGWFFLVILLALLSYFGLGAYYNYATYGARGMDLIPHRDFWNEVPYMLRDIGSHLCSVVRPRRATNRGGYIAV